MEEKIPVTEARAQFSELINRVGYGKERIVLTRHGKPLVALVPAEVVSAPAVDDPAAASVLDPSAQSTSYRSSLGIAAEDSTEPHA